MAPSSSSTRKAARLAQKGRGRRVRFQGGTLFPLIVAIVLVVGFALVVYARASRPDDVPPGIGSVDHWHGAYGFQLCGDSADYKLTGTLEERDQFGNLLDSEFRATGVHSHDDGVIHWHAYGTRAMGRNAKLGVFFDNYDIEISNDRLALPEGLLLGPNDAAVSTDFPLVYEEGETECAGEEATLKIVVWTDRNDPDSDQVYTSSLDDIPFDRDGLVFTIAYVPDDVDVVMPSWAADLTRLGAADSPTPPDTLAPGETLPQDATEPGGTMPEGTDAPETTDAGDDPAPETTTG